MLWNKDKIKEWMPQRLMRAQRRKNNQKLMTRVWL